MGVSPFNRVSNDENSGRLHSRSGMSYVVSSFLSTKQIRGSPYIGYTYKITNIDGL